MAHLNENDVLRFKVIDDVDCDYLPVPTFVIVDTKTDFPVLAGMKQPYIGLFAGLLECGHIGHVFEQISDDDNYRELFTSWLVQCATQIGETK